MSISVDNTSHSVCKDYKPKVCEGEWNAPPPSHPYKAIGQQPTHVGRGWHTSEIEEEDGGAEYLVLVLMKAL